jgi:NADH dehydrogenase FAD-containing subunit
MVPTRSLKEGGSQLRRALSSLLSSSYVSSSTRHTVSDIYYFQVATAGRRGVNTSFLTAAKSPSAPGINGSLNAGGFVETTSTLQLKKNPRVFAGGDVVAFPEQHTFIKAGVHGPLIAGNIIALINAAENTGNGRLKEYTKPTDTIIITNGRVSDSPLYFLSFDNTEFDLQTRGSGYIDFFTFFGRPIIIGNWFSAMMKSKGLFIGMSKGIMNQS